MFDKSPFGYSIARSQRRHNTVFRMIVAIIALIFVAIIGFWVIAGVVAVTAVDQVSEKGLRGVAEQIWCGQAPNCKLP